MSKRKVKAATGEALTADAIITILAAQAARDAKRRHRVTYSQGAAVHILADAVAKALASGEHIQAARARYEAATLTGAAHDVAIVRRSQIVAGAVAARVAREGGNDRPENTVRIRLASWARIRGLAAVGGLTVAVARGKAREADPEVVIIGRK